MFGGRFSGRYGILDGCTGSRFDGEVVFFGFLSGSLFRGSGLSHSSTLPRSWASGPITIRVRLGDTFLASTQGRAEDDLFQQRVEIFAIKSNVALLTAVF